MTRNHWVIFIDNASNKRHVIEELLSDTRLPRFEEIQGLQGALFSKLALEQFIDQEERHGAKTITSKTVQSLKTMSSGEQKKTLLKHMLQSNPDYLVLDNPFDNLDTDSQEELKQRLQQISSGTFIILIISRKSDLLPFINTYARLDNKVLKFYDDAQSALGSENEVRFHDDVPSPPHLFDFEGPILVELRNVNVSYSGRPILKSINWTIQKGDFWELKGKNGSGKTTILSMITGENPKGYGQDLYIFGQKKGSGESVWDIKRKIGYFTTAMTDKFTGYHSVENMIISGLNDSIGLYAQPTEAQLRLSKKWLLLIQMWHLKDFLYHDLTMGQKRLIMCVRAMIKHPILLILDEPTAGLDDKSALLFVALVNKFAAESETAIIFVSHRKEPGLKPKFTYELQATDKGSVGTVR